MSENNLPAANAAYPAAAHHQPHQAHPFQKTPPSFIPSLGPWDHHPAQSPTTVAGLPLFGDLGALLKQAEVLDWGAEALPAAAAAPAAAFDAGLGGVVAAEPDAGLLALDALDLSCLVDEAPLDLGLAADGEEDPLFYAAAAALA